MILERIAIQEFQQFAGRIEIKDLTEGLNVFVGANEQGKSTIARAVRTAFIERHKVTTLKELRPWAKPSGNPLVEIDFRVDDKQYALKKQFFRPRCELAMAGKTLNEDKAEDFLASLMGFTHSPKGATRPEHAGVPGLLWVEQGKVQDVKGAAGNAASYLRDALAQLAGSEVSGGEDVLIGAVQRELFQLLTDKQRRPTGVMLDAINQHSALTVQLDELTKQSQQYNADVDVLARVQAEHAKVSGEKPWEEFDLKIAQAEAKVKAVGPLEQRVSQLRELLRSTGAELSLLLEQEAGDVQTERRVQEQRETLAVAQAELEQANVALAQATTVVAEAAQAHRVAKDACDLASDAAVKPYLVELSDVYQEQALFTVEMCDQAREVEAEMAVVRAKMPAPVDSASLLELRGAVAFLNDCAALEKTGFPKVRYWLTAPVLTNEGPLSGNGELLVDGNRHIDFLESGSVEVIPAIDSVALAEKRACFEGIRDEVLKRLDAVSVEEVEARVVDYASGVEKLAALERLRAAYASAGSLEGYSRIATRQKELRARLQSLPAIEGGAGVAEARRQLDEAAARLDETRQALSRATDARSAVNARVDSLSTALKAAEAQLQDPVFVGKRASRSLAIVEKRAAVTGLQGQVEGAERELEAARTSEVAAELDRLRAASNAARAGQKDREGQMITLRSRLETVGALGLDERIAQLKASVEQGERRVAELRLRADALALLEKSLIDERDRAVEKLRAPLTKKLVHYLKFLFKDSTIVLTEDLSPVVFNRSQQGAELEALSFGTQEQLGVLTRLAYADLLKEAGRPTLIMLDDVGGFTDNGRLDGLKEALKDAATRHQVLLFTCRPKDWADLGVPHRSVEDLKAAA